MVVKDSTRFVYVVLCKTCIVYWTAFDTTNWFCGSLLFLVFCQWLLLNKFAHHPCYTEIFCQRHGGKITCV